MIRGSLIPKMIGEAMKYYPIETSYGPTICPRGWETMAGTTRFDGGFIHLLAAENQAEIILRQPHLRGGGDVERTICIDVDACTSASRIQIHFNLIEGDRDGRGFRLDLTADRLEAFLGSSRITQAKHAGLKQATASTFRLATLGTRYQLWSGEMLLAAGEGEHPFHHNEGTMGLTVTAAEVRLLSFEEKYITAAKTITTWQKSDLLYEE